MYALCSLLMSLSIKAERHPNNLQLPTGVLKSA